MVFIKKALSVLYVILFVLFFLIVDHYNIKQGLSVITAGKQALILWVFITLPCTFIYYEIIFFIKRNAITKATKTAKINRKSAHAEKK